MNFKGADTNSKMIGIGAAAILALAIFSFYKGKAQASTKIDHVPLPDENGQLSNTDAQLVREMVLKLYDALKGVGNPFRDEKPFVRLANASDKLFVAVYNDFNQLYAKEDRGTLRDWIKDDWYFEGTQTAGAVLTILGRMDTLNLR